MSKKILGLDLGTNSIGWALIEIDEINKTVKIVGLGSRIIPMDSQEFSKFNAGQKIVSAAANRTTLHRTRITKERYLLRRDRLHLVLNLIEALPEHYKIDIDFERNGKNCGQFKDEKEPKISYLPTKNIDNKYDFYFEDAFNEMIEDLQKVNPEIKNKKNNRVPKDWTIYFLRNKAMTKAISLEELSWVLLSYNQKRGTDLLENENENEKSDEIKEQLDLKVINVENKKDLNGDFFEITLNDSENFTYKEYSSLQLTFKDDVKEITKTLKLDSAGNIIHDKTTYQISDLYNLTLSNIEHRETDDKKFKHVYDFIYTNGWKNEKKKQKFDISYQKLGSKIKEEGQTVKDLFVISNKYDCKGNPETIIPNIKLPDFNSEGSKDWTLLKKKTEKDIIAYNISKEFVNADGSAKHYISPKIYDVLKNDVITGERTKIIGGLFQTIDRKFYREELIQIINTQRKFHTATLDDKAAFEKCVNLLYPNNEEHAKSLLENKEALTNLLVEDVLLYQRPPKSKKSEISDCKHEIDFWKEEVNTSTGEIVEIPIYKKAVSASHPLFQEYRIWDKIHNIKLIQLDVIDSEGNSETNVDITQRYFQPKDYEALFNHFNNRSTVTIEDFLTFCKNRFGLDIGKKGERKVLWNYPVEEEFKGNETRKSFEIRFKRCGFEDFETFMTQQKEIELWHYLYSVSTIQRKKVCKTLQTLNPKFGKTSIQNFFKTFFNNENVEGDVFEKLCRDFEDYPKFPSKYAAYSIKALNKLLSVMRLGENFLTIENATNNWQEKYIERVDTILTKNRQIDWTAKIIDFNFVVETEVNRRKGEIPLPKGLFKTFKSFESISDFHFLNLTQASYFIYGRHSELAEAKYWDTPEKIREEITKELKQHSLNNPTAEKVLKETMKVVADIWEIYGKSKDKFFNEIHLEVARELQKSNQEKKDITDRQKNSRTENNRLRSILEEFLIDSSYNAKKGNQDHFERLKIVEDGAKTNSFSDKEFYSRNKDKFSKSDIDAILKKQKITKADFEKYKLWIEQGYKSPYTGAMISLTDLFNGSKYNVDHIFARASISNDSLSNKVVCEAVINRFKSSKTGREFISQFGGKTHTIFDEKLNKQVIFTLIDETSYVNLVKLQFKDAKRMILLAKDVPSGFTESQLNNSKYISRKAMELLSHVVREQGEVEFRSKNVLPVTGMITDRLKKEWKINQIWTKLLTPRFERLNKIHKNDDFGSYKISKNGQEYYDINTENILEKNEKFDLKRLDHRHHALDALIIAMCTENHVQYFNNINSGITNKKKEKMEAIQKQRAGIKRQIMYCEKDKENPKDIVWRYMLPCSYREKTSVISEKKSVIDVLWSNNYSANETKDYKKTILESLENCVVSFKSDFKLVSKSSNKYESYYDENGNLRLNENGKPLKKLISQKNLNQNHWSIRKPLHTDNPSAKIELQFDRLKLVDNLGKADLIIDEKLKNIVNEILGQFNSKIGEAKKHLLKNPIISEDQKIEYADFKISNTKYRKRQPITNLSVRTGTGALATLDAVIDRINKVADFVLRNDLLNHLKINENDIDKAFSIEGINEFNANRKIPVYRLPISESATLKFQIGSKNSNSHKWVETGGNFHYKITQKEDSRDYETIPLRTAVSIEKEYFTNKQDIQNNDEITLSPNDLVYLPIEKNEILNLDYLTIIEKKRIYKFVSSTEKEAHFIPYSNSAEIIKNENGTNSKSERIQNFFDGNILCDEKDKAVQIKSICIKLKVDRLGNISKA